MNEPEGKIAPSAVAIIWSNAYFCFFIVNNLICKNKIKIFQVDMDSNCNFSPVLVAAVPFFNSLEFINETSSHDLS